MLAVVIPAQNEAGRVGVTIARSLRLPVDIIIPVVNGCADQTEAEVRAIRDRRLYPLYWKEPLGLDVPRSVGAAAALGLGATAVLFVDGDMIGEMEPALRLLLQAVRRGPLDMALTHMRRPPALDPNSMAHTVTALRRELNQSLELAFLGDAAACHGPHAVSRRLLTSIPLRELGIPPVCQALAVQLGLRVGVGAVLSHTDLRHRSRSAEHRRRVGETITGDLLEAVHLTKGRARSRHYNGRHWLGFHPQRRFDLIAQPLIASAETGG